jgi:hypothetical protein
LQRTSSEILISSEEIMDWLWIFGGLTVLAVVVVHLTVDGSSAVRASGLLPPNRGLP